MAKRHHPRRGSMAYSPRKRAKSHIAKFSSWHDIEDGPRILDFAGYKAGMTHILMVDPSEHSTTSRMEIKVPVTVIEVPPIKVVGIRLYRKTPYGLRIVGETWSEKLDKELRRRFPIPSESKQKQTKKEITAENVDDVRLIVHTQPKLITGVPKKVPDIMETRISGGTIEERLEYAKSYLGKELKITDFAVEGKFVDVASITKGKGFQGHVKRWGVKRQPRKNSKHIRMIGTLGPHFPSYVLPTVPQAGQMGYHQRTEYNKWILKIGASGEEITPKGGFLRYGIVRNQYVLLKGSVPGPAKRLIRLREPTRYPYKEIIVPEITYISVESKQGR